MCANYGLALIERVRAVRLCVQVYTNDTSINVCIQTKKIVYIHTH